MPVLEAMACGTPVFVTRGGATDDFVTDEIGFRMPAERVALGTAIGGEELAAPGWVLEVSQATLRTFMRYAFEHRDEIRTVGERAARVVRDTYTWQHAGRKAVARLEAVIARPPIVREPATNDLNAYEATFHSHHGEDGILVELFARLRSSRPYFVELGAGAGEHGNGAALARMFGWHGLFIEGNATIYEQLVENYRTLPRVHTHCAMADRETIARIFDEHQVPHTLDLLSIDVAGTDAHLWEALAAYAARVVVIAFPPDGASLASLAALGDRLGYALLGIESAGVSAFFVRRDLLPTVGFPERQPAGSAR
jgi:hypothetical protein